MLVFWVSAIILTIAACLAVLYPFLRPRQPESAGEAYDIEVYRDQLTEIDADASRGLIEASEAAEARAEIGRRILKVHSPGETGRTRLETVGKWLVTASVVLVPLLSWGIYSVTGSPNLPGQPLQARLEKNPAESSISELVAQAEGHLAQNPEDGRGWDAIAPIYVRVRRYDDAVGAYQNAIRINGANARRQAGLGEALTATGRGLVSDEARTAFHQALLLQPGNPKARFFLAMATAQAGSPKKAISDWESLAADVSPESPWKFAALSAIRGVRENLKQTETAEDRGPDADDIAKAQEMSADDRGAMIESMVAGLAARLEENPKDREGWQKLIRSYVVLGKQQDARAAYQRGLKVFEDDPEAVAELNGFANGLGLLKVD